MPEGPRRRAVLLAVALAGGVGGPLAGCARIPTTGPVLEGGTLEAEPETGYRVEPVGPVDGSTPEEVVRGFLLAGVGVDDDFGAARAFLSSGRRASWRPTARTVVHPATSLDLAVGEVVPPVGDEVPAADPAAGSAEGPAAGPAEGATVPVAVGTVVTAEVDAAGRYRPGALGQRLDVALTLVGERGQWRISDAPDLLLLDESRFRSTFRLHPVVFAGRSDDRPVPDGRWLLDRTSTATTLVEQVLAGPPAWLAPAVVSGAPAGTVLPPGSVVVSGGVTTVDLPASLQRERTAALRRLQQQLVATLRGLGAGAGSGTSEVRVTLAGGALAATSAPELPGPGDDAPVVLSEGRVCRLRAGQPVPVEGLPVLDGASDPALLGDQVVVLLAGRTQLQRFTTGSAGTAVAAAPVALGEELTPPSLDGWGWAWTTAAASPGSVTAVGRDGAAAVVAAPWLAGRRVVGLRAASDGARVLVTSTGEPGQPDAVRVDVAAVARTGAGAPEALTADTEPPTPWLAQVRAAAWVGPMTVAVLGVVAPGSAQASSASAATADLAGAAPAVWLVDGGRASDLGGPPADAGAVRLAAGAGRQSVVVGGADGRLWPREGSRWLPLPLEVPAYDPAYPG